MNKSKRRAAVLLFILAVFASAVACNESGARRCYSTFPGCEATAEVLATAAAHGE